jgi:hypothetical protein
MFGNYRGRPSSAVRQLEQVEERKKRRKKEREKERKKEIAKERNSLSGLLFLTGCLLLVRAVV